MRDFDFNLLTVLEVLLEEQSVTATAARLHLSQSAVSKQLAKLRDTFDDKLFERTSHGLRPTPKALYLAPELRQILNQMSQLTRPNEFKPELSQRQFRIHMVETAYSMTYPYFMPELLQKAPNIKLNSQTWDLGTLEMLQRCEIDLGIACLEWDSRSLMHIHNLPDDLECVELLRDHPVCLVSHHHPVLKEPWNLASFLKYRHLQVTFGGIEHWLLDEVLSLEHLNRVIAVNMTDFHSAMHLCEHSELLLCCPAKYAAQMSQHFALTTLAIPTQLIPGAYVLLWHKHFNFDPSHTWLRELISSRTVAHYQQPD